MITGSLLNINTAMGLQGYQARRIAFNLNLSGTSFKNMVKFADALYRAYAGSDASLFEINPVVRTSDEKIFAVDAKVAIDNNALYRHHDIASR